MRGSLGTSSKLCSFLRPHEIIALQIVQYSNKAQFHSNILKELPQFLKTSQEQNSFSAIASRINLLGFDIYIVYVFRFSQVNIRQPQARYIRIILLWRIIKSMKAAILKV